MDPLKNSNELSEIGYAVSINNYLIAINGLPGVAINELVLSQRGTYGVVTALKPNYVEVLMLQEAHVKPNELFQRTFQALTVPLGDYLLGRVINPLGTPIDGKGRFPKASTYEKVNQPIPDIGARQFIKDQLETGITTVDMLIPIAYGQRELVMGDARSGKTSFIIDLIVNQKNKNIICVYSLIGRPISQIKQITEALTVNEALKYTVLIAASSSELASLIYFTPFSATTVAEYFQSQGKNVILILDDMGNHAKAYREIALLGHRIPGRESYPGDIFYTHARLMERAGKFTEAGGGGSITALPVIEVNLDDSTGFIPTNLMAMTDGHLMFNSKFHHQGLRPAIDTSLSVSRVGRQAQWPVEKLLSDSVRTIITESKKLETLSRFGSELSEETQRMLKQSKQIEAVLSQGPLIQISLVHQMIMLGLTFTKLFAGQEVNFVILNKDKIINFLKVNTNIEKLTAQVSTLAKLEDFLKIVEGLEPEIAKVCQS